MTEKDEPSIVSGEPRYGKQDPTWLDHLGDRKPAAAEHAAAPDDTRVVHIVGYWQGLLERLRIKVPRTLCGASLATPGPELGPDAPMCPECERVDAGLPLASADVEPQELSVSGAWFDAAMNVVIATALLVMATIAHPPAWAAAVAALIIASVYLTAWECAREAIRYGEA